MPPMPARLLMYAMAEECPKGSIDQPETGLTPKLRMTHCKKKKKELS